MAGGGIAQLARDVCRVLEIVPDVDATKMCFKLAVALPDVEADLVCEECLAGKCSVQLLTKSELQDKTKVKDFLSTEKQRKTSDVASSRSIHAKLVGRYLGELSLVNLKTNLK